MPCKIYYFSLTDEQTKTEKLEWFKNTKLQDIDFQLIKPDKNNNWINLADEDNGFDNLIPLITKEKTEQQIFAFSSLGVNTARDEWVYDFSKENLEKKVQFFIQQYNNFLDKNDNSWNENIKWSRDLKNKFIKKQRLIYKGNLIIKANYRPFLEQFYYAEKILSDVLTQNHYDIFGGNLDNENIYIAHIGNDTQKPFTILLGNKIPSLNYLSPASISRLFPLYRYVNGEKVENITDWALSVFSKQYSVSSEQLSVNSEQKEITDNCSLITEKLITKLDIFHYVYAILHKPEYRTKYEQNLKREFPRIPLYDDFWKYAEAGKKLMELHINYELEITNYKPLLTRKDIDLEVFKAGKAGKKKKTSDADKEVAEVTTAFTVYPILKIKDNNIEIDELTTLCGVPAQALAYKLGNRSAIEWVLDQYKPYKSDDKTIQEQFNNYNFADYKEQVIDLLQKVCWLSVETMKIVGEL
jgi:predicted helicase